MRTHGLTLLTAAHNVAQLKHAGQFRADGKRPYIMHPLRAEAIFIERYSLGLSEYDIIRGRALTVTHDVPEECPDVTWEWLAEQGLEGIIPELKLLTRFKGASYLQYLLAIRATKDEVLIRVKASDMDANMEDLPEHPSKAARKSLAVKYELAKYILLTP